MNAKKWDFWKKIRDWSDRKMSKAWMEGGNCDSKCPRCRQWESRGNIITTKSLPDGSELRRCENCCYQWKALFTPAGFMRIED